MQPSKAPVAQAEPRDVPPPLWAFPWYLAGSSAWVAAMTLQSMLVTWLLVDTLQQPPSVLGMVRSLMTLPPLVFLLVGGLWADRTDLRTLVCGASAFALVLAIPMVVMPSLTTVWAVAGLGTAFALVQGLSDPARNAMINRVTRFDIQRSVALVFILPSLASFGALWIGGRQEILGPSLSFLVLAMALACSLIFFWLCPKLPGERGERPDVFGGLKALRVNGLVRDIVAINFVSSLFNAGAYVVAAPLIANRIYEGDATFFALMLASFTVGSTSSNAVLLFIMPVLKPGRWFLMLQLTRAAILAGVFLQPGEELFLSLIGLWGLNMGCTSTFARSMVQELAPQRTRAQVLSFFLLSFMLASPVSAFVLGWIIEWTSPMTPMLTGMVISGGIFVVGVSATGLWSYRSGLGERQTSTCALMYSATKSGLSMGMKWVRPGR